MASFTMEDIEREILESKAALRIERMPCTAELRTLNKGRLHTRIGRNGGYRYWADKLGLELKSSSTSVGNDFEELIADKLRVMGYEVKQMSTKHPYDLLVNEGVKVDVKCANKYKEKYDYDAWTFNLHKTNPTCDIYIFIALNADGTIQREMVVPSVLVYQKVVTIGKVSEYDKYHELYDYVQKYSDFLKQVTRL